MDALRAILRLQEEVGARTLPGSDDPQLGRAAAAALRELGGVADPPEWSLRDYDAERLGPIFGVSDDGDAAPQIVRAFLDSPKAVALRKLDLLSPRTIGAVVDAERMTAAGELLVGPGEYVKVRAAVAGRVPMTTNVGTLVLPRFFHALPFITYRVDGEDDPLARTSAELERTLEPFRNPPGGTPLPVTVFVAFGDKVHRDTKVEVLRTLAASLDSDRERLGLLQRARERESKAPMFAIDIAAEAGLTDVMIEGDARFEAQDQLLLPGLLAFFDDERVNEILAHARECGVTVVPKNRIDVGTAARTIWAGLSVARGMGAQLGKFGLFPLTVEQQVEAMRTVRPWFPDWTPAPAFYVDRPLVAEDGVHKERALVEIAKRWLAGARDAGADVVLIDSPDRTSAPAGSGSRDYNADRGRRLLKRDEADADGVFTLDDLATIDAAARSDSPQVRILWAGGLTGRQAYELARRHAFGIFTTSTTARRVAVGDAATDPAATSEMEPTYLGVLGVRMVIEAGFLESVSDKAEAAAIKAAAEPVLAAIQENQLTSADDDHVPALDALRELLEPAWERQLARIEQAAT